ncbi:Hypothetical protein LUCI_5138 [Lucifera butyrica]|uniref:Flavin reductase like domain-containing protein n=1 Tax=Lucifera butyrica TaxID=1351585 RepID=A0A498RGA3_9FIRM|nr:flavin reductase family protein [Lucifera butyrica]VBB09840.1 Hypothetical protein LUCI_5138 [Lucifera butyrica]
MKQVSYNEYAAKVMEGLPQGAFLTTAHAGKINSMTIGWGSLGVMWRKPVFLVMVRPSRFTFELIEKSNEFTVSVPLHDMKQALSLCGTKSGREMDKLATAGLKAVPGQTIATPVIAGCGLHYECKVIYKQAMLPDALEKELTQSCYPAGDHHTLYYGEITATYLDE